MQGSPSRMKHKLHVLSPMSGMKSYIDMALGRTPQMIYIDMCRVSNSSYHAAIGYTINHWSQNHRLRLCSNQCAIIAPCTYLYRRQDTLSAQTVG